MDIMNLGFLILGIKMIITVILSITGFYTMLLLIKALKIYIKSKS
ncbi:MULTISPECIES: hypothetical protein [Clostridium]|uniref:Uncharacterized protein n=1 Tax=Clostridium butyricum TaxID=1492 RepID=A0A6N3F258_CLOBU|nr:MULTISPECIES: hypothetical protein [Clostridium]EMU52471.1 hypothetical protein CBDKU1_36020 [Clostridium butyricum DKU-01]ENZ32740.1 hypothetical protein HMPREF1084_02411 [Clostridium butyricum 60E.3]KIU04682.1 hypothetical protein SC08_Contig95orf00110 [Clostridium butyricum]KJZ86563.1 Tellurite resistance protein [Clostridium sp. IBUN13A]KJZ88537.1 hypothetical protein ClosIBUN125C_CONTIG21g01344 [Clostridium sp. IBUN125C]